MHALSTTGRRIAAGLCLLTLSSPVLADDPASGWGLATGLPHPGQSTIRTLSSGDVVTFDGATIDRWTAAGAHVATLGGFSPARYGGCFEVSPDETYVLVGETGDVTDPTFAPSGDLYRVPLDGSGPALLDPSSTAYLNTLIFNFDAAFETNDRVIVSAATDGFGTGNQIVRLDTLTGDTHVVAQVDGPSGPLAYDAGGNLWYATQSDLFPSPPGSTDVLVFPGPLPVTGPALTEASAITFSTGFDGASDLEWEGSTGIMLLVENNFGTGTNRIYRLGNSPANSTVLVEGAPFGWIGGVEFEADAGPETFHAYQPASDDLVRYTWTDFFSTWDRVEVRPARPELAFDGPGVGAVGQVDIDVTGGAPGGEAMLFIGPTPYGAEVPYALAQTPAPLFSGLNPAAYAVVPSTILLDGSGNGSLSFLHSGSLTGLVAAQAVVLDSKGTIVGTSSGASL